jgi:hypothetical protein
LKTEVKRFTAATAEATGQDERTIRRDASRGERIADAALHRLRGTRLDSGAFLDRLKQIDQDKQLLYVEAALAEEKRKAADVKENRRKLSEVRHAVRLTHMGFVQANGAAKAGQVAQKFPIVYADPPWQFGVRSEKYSRLEHFSEYSLREYFSAVVKETVFRENGLRPQPSSLVDPLH